MLDKLSVTSAEGVRIHIDLKSTVTTITGDTGDGKSFILIL